MAVTVRVVVVVPSAVNDVGAATSVQFGLDTTPAVNVTAAVVVTMPTVAVTVFACAVVDESVAVNTPALSVVPDTGVNTLFVPVPDSDTN